MPFGYTHVTASRRRLGSWALAASNQLRPEDSPIEHGESERCPAPPDAPAAAAGEEGRRQDPVPGTPGEGGVGGVQEAGGSRRPGRLHEPGLLLHEPRQPVLRRPPRRPRPRRLLHRQHRSRRLQLRHAGTCIQTLLLLLNYHVCSLGVNDAFFFETLVK